MTIRRGFADLDHGQVHYRSAGTGRPILLLHPSPGSSRQLTPLIGDLASAFSVIAPDTPGNGDSSALPIEAPTIADYARILSSFLDALGLDRVDVYGSHTGASIAAEFAALAPDRVSRVILDGLGVFPPAQRAELLEHYAPPFAPDLDGAYLMRAFQFLRDQYIFFPWYARSAAARVDGGLPQPADLHRSLTEVLKANETYHLSYRAAFAWDATEALPRVAHPTLVISADDDPLSTATRDAATLLPNGHFEALPPYGDPSFGAARLETMERFLRL